MMTMMMKCPPLLAIYSYPGGYYRIPMCILYFDQVSPTPHTLISVCGSEENRLAYLAAPPPPPPFLLSSIAAIYLTPPSLTSSSFIFHTLHSPPPPLYPHFPPSFSAPNKVIDQPAPPSSSLCYTSSSGYSYPIHPCRAWSWIQFLSVIKVLHQHMSLPTLPQLLRERTRKRKRAEPSLACEEETVQKVV